MAGFLLIAPTGTGKSTARKDDPRFQSVSSDGDKLADYPWGISDWSAQDRKNMDKVITHMREENKCVCWFVGTTAVADAIEDGRLSIDEIAIVLLPEKEHRKRVEFRNKSNHGWDTAEVHRDLCESLIERYKIRKFESLEEAFEFARCVISG
jgi:hypothetical protein